MQISTLFFDLDDTLYPPSSGLWTVLRARIESYLSERMNLPAEGLPALRRELFLTYGTTLRGLQMTRGVDTLDFLAYVHDVPLADYLTPDPAARAMLLALPQRKVIFTNADTNHARRVLAALQLSDCFEQIIDVLAIAPYCKPQPQAFALALQIARVDDPRTCVMIDDAPRNLAPARQLGMYTIRAGSVEPSPEYDAGIACLTDLPAVLPLDGRRA